jgi:hypothetical protein
MTAEIINDKVIEGERHAYIHTHTHTVNTYIGINIYTPTHSAGGGVHQTVRPNNLSPQQQYLRRDCLPDFTSHC